MTVIVTKVVIYPFQTYNTHDIRDKRFQHSRQLLQASEKCSNFALVKPKDVHQPLG